MEPEDSIDYFDKVLDMVTKKPFDPDQMNNLLGQALQVVEDIQSGFDSDDYIKLLCLYVEDIAAEWGKRT